MELEKSNIHMNKIVESQRATFYVTKECNLPKHIKSSGKDYIRQWYH